jgi:hypothetical protein
VLHVRVHQRQLDVVERVGARQQIERLEHEPDLLIADVRHLVVGHGRYLLVLELVGALGRSVETADDVHERRFAGARRSHDRDVLVLRDVEIDAVQCVHFLGADLIDAVEIADLDQHGLIRPFVWARPRSLS